MSIESAFNITNRDHKREETKVGRHGRRANKSDDCGENENRSANLSAGQVEGFVSHGSRADHIPLRFAVSARLFGASLDDKLAQGRAPESSVLLAIRSQLINTLANRRELSKNWLDLLVRAREPFRPLGSSVPLVRSRVIVAQPQILALADALLAPMPNSLGVAMASSLLSDGAGPIYNGACSVDLGSTLCTVIAKLDPLAA